jgi:hypothetical protein
MSLHLVLRLLKFYGTDRLRDFYIRRLHNNCILPIQQPYAMSVIYLTFNKRNKTLSPCLLNISPKTYLQKLQLFIEFDVCKSVHHHTIQINWPTRCKSFTSLLLDVYVWLNKFWALPCPSSGAYNRISSLWFYRWIVAIAASLVAVWQTTMSNNNVCKTRDC